MGAWLLRSWSILHLLKKTHLVTKISRWVQYYYSHFTNNTMRFSEGIMLSKLFGHRTVEMGYKGKPITETLWLGPYHGHLPFCVDLTPPPKYERHKKKWARGPLWVWATRKTKGHWVEMRMIQISQATGPEPHSCNAIENHNLINYHLPSMLHNVWDNAQYSWTLSEDAKHSILTL